MRLVGEDVAVVPLRPQARVYIQWQTITLCTWLIVKVASFALLHVAANRLNLFGTWQLAATAST
jgi:hypothetical protein